MISEKKFIEIYNSFWNELLPNGDRVLRMINLNSSRYTLPIDTISDSGERGLVNEMGFRLFVEWARIGINQQLPIDSISRVKKNSIQYISRFREDLLNKKIKISKNGLEETRSLAKNLKIFVNTKNINRIKFNPKFIGCGFLNDCEGDIVIDNTLIEVKSGDRQFRLNDIRQLLVYCALNYIKQLYSIDSITLLNPRRGTYFNINIDTLCREMSGIGCYQVFYEIVEFTSQTQTSS